MFIYNYILPPVIILNNLVLILFNIINNTIQYIIISSEQNMYSNTIKKVVLGNIALNNFLRNKRLNS